MNRPVPSPAAAASCKARAVEAPQGVMALRAAANPQREVRPEWAATIVLAAAFARLRAMHESTTDRANDLSDLTDACRQIASDIGAEAIVQRALDALRPARFTPRVFYKEHKQ